MTYKIQMFVDVFEDKYEQGEEIECTYANMEEFNINAGNPMEALIAVVRDNIGLETKPDEWYISEGSGLLGCVKFVDDVWDEILGVRWDEWKEGKLKGYNLYINAEVYECKPINPQDNDFFKDLEVY